MSLNKVLLIGNLGQDPKTGNYNGKSVSNFSIATSEKWNDKEGNLQSKTQWHYIEVWGPKADNCNKYLHKGSKVFVEGRLEVSNYEDKTSGTQKTSVKIVADTVTFLDSKSDDSGSQYQGGGNQGGGNWNQGGGNQGGWNQGGGNQWGWNQGGGNQGGWNQGGGNQGGGNQQSKTSQPAWGQSSWDAANPSGNNNWGGQGGGDGDDGNMPF